MTTLRFRAAALAIASAAAVGTLWSAPAFAKSGDAVRKGACGRTSDWKLKLGPAAASSRRSSRSTRTVSANGGV